MNFHEMGSSRKALQSSWVKRLRPREVQGTWVVSPKSRPASAPVFRQEKEESEGKASSSTSRCVIHPLVLPKVESVFDEPVKRMRVSPSASVDSKDLVTETQVVASFGPFQVRARSLVPLKEKKQQQQAEMGRTAALAPAEHWKQYFLGRERELTVVTEPNPSATAWSRRMIKPCSEDRQDNRGGLLGSEIDSTYSPRNKEIMIDRRNKHANPNPLFGSESDQLRSNKQMLEQFEWQSPEKNKWNNPGFCKEIVPSSGEHVITGNQKMDRIGYERRPEAPAFATAFRRSNANAVNCFSGFGLHATSNDLPYRFPVLKQTLVPENCSNHRFMDQQATWKPEAFPSVKANSLEPGSSRKEHCQGPPPMLESHKYGIGQGSGRLNCMENYPIHSSNYPRSARQRDEIILPDSSSTVSLPNELHHRKDVLEPDVHPGSGTSFRESHVAYYRPIQERDYLEPESNSSHHSNCPGLDQEDNSTRLANRKTRLSKEFSKANDGWSDIKGKGTNFENPLTEQRHAIEGSTGNVVHYKSCDSALNRNFQVGEALLHFQT
ncbi:uncharacterized protein LOC131855770 [Cryptomeria japonica]|uniref:uncharacterized protein LOC131855770 n=1 Tax=Cryptomeria japonica TaxID=3369 RepID=UPI0027DA3D1A|nr:uncharacterized protein LOC131855770 [Cryptomeria japonica]